MNDQDTNSGPGHVVEVEDDTGRRRIPLHGISVFGRETGDVLIADGAVSGRHLEFDARGPALLVTDLGSSNGTFRGGERIDTDVALAPGDELRLGAATIRVLASPVPATPPPPPTVIPTPEPATDPAPAPAPAPTPTATPAPAPAPAAAAAAAPVAGSGALRTDVAEVRFVPGTYGEEIAKSYASAVARARKTLAGFGTEPWGSTPIFNLIDPYHDGTSVVASGSVIEAHRGEAWLIVSPESPPEPPHRILALMFGSAFPTADQIQPLLEGFGLHRSGAPSPADELSGQQLPSLEQAEGELRGVMALSFVRFLIDREGEEGLTRLFGAKVGNIDEAAREVYGPSLGQLDQLWRRKAMSGAPDVKTGEFIRMSLRYLRPYKLRQVEIFGYMLLSLAFVATFPFVTRRLFDTALPSGEFSQVLNLLLILGASFIVSLVAGVRQAYQTAWVSNAVTRDIRQSIFDRVQVMPAPWFSEHPQGDVLSRLFNDVGQVEDGMSTAIGQGVYQVVSLVISSAIMLAINLWLGLIVLAAAPLVGIVYRTMAAGALSRSIAVQENSSSLLSVAAENYHANPVVKMFGLADRERRRFAQQGDRLFRSTRRLTLFGGMFGLSVNLIVTLLRLGVLGFGAWLILNGHFTMGGLVAFLSIMGDVLSPVTVLVTLSQSVQASMGSLVRINEVIDARSEPDEAPLGSLPPLNRELRLAGIGFSYTPERRALDSFDISIPAGTRTAFVGPSGSGKSTVLRLLMRLYEPDAGAILVDGVDVRDGSLRSWREQLGVVFQDSFLFDATVRENIAMGRAGSTNAEIEAAAAAAGVDDFLDSLPRGWDTLVGEGGSNLSGGQRQRVAIARALIRNPRLLVLDEATSALDPATERQINDTIQKVGQGRTVVAVTHRLASITDYDKIVVIVDGRLAESGTHEELLAHRGPYARLWAEQTGTPLPEVEAIDVPAALRRVSFLSGIDDRIISELAEQLVPFTLDTGRSVAEGDGVMLIMRGHGLVVSASNTGEVVTAHLRPGDTFGVSAALGAPPTSSLQAEDPMELLHLSSAVLAEFAARHDELGGRLRSNTVLEPPKTATRLGRVTLARPAMRAEEARRTMAVFAPPARADHQ